MSFRRTSLALSVAASAIALFGITQEAQAGALGYSLTEISNFTISNASGILVDGVGVTVVNPLNTESTSATLNGVNTTNSTLAIAPNVNQSCLGSCAAFTPAGNPASFTLVTPVLALATTPFSQSATELSPNGVVTLGGIPAGANANSEAQVQLLGANTGQSNANITASAGFTLVLTGAVGTSENVTGSFNALTKLLAQTDATGASGIAQSDYEIQITDVNNNVLFDWKPNGTNGGASGSDLVSVNDQTVNLNNQRSANFDNLILPYNANANGLAFTAFLPEGVNLNFSITQRNIASAVSVPEPMSLALFGAGLFGLGVMARRRRRRV